MGTFDINAFDSLLPTLFPMDAEPPALDAEMVREAACWLDLPDDARAAVGRGLEAMSQDARRERLWRRFHRHWILAGPQHIEDAWPWPARTDEAGAMFYALLCLSGVPHGRSLLERRGLSAAIVRASFQDVARQMEQCRRAHGCWGVAQPRWLGRHLHGRLVELGRLQYEVGVMIDKPANRADIALIAALRERGLTLDSPVWWMHIPGDSPLSPDAVNESLDLARDLLPRHFPEHRAACLACCSWILDSQLREYLPADANLLRFAGRFELVYEHDGNAGFEPFPFNASPTGKLTRLQEAALEHQRRGRSWRAGLGLMPIATQQ